MQEERPLIIADTDSTMISGKCGVKAESLSPHYQNKIKYVIGA